VSDRDRPNILVIWGDDIGITNLSCYSDGLMGYRLLPYLTGEVDKSPRQMVVYFSDDGDVLALRFDYWKVVFMEQRVRGTCQIWGRAVRGPARPQAVQPAHRPLRAGRHHHRPGGGQARGRPHHRPLGDVL
jgi:hypothetical protein